MLQRIILNGVIGFLLAVLIMSLLGFTIKVVPMLIGALIGTALSELLFKTKT